MCPKFVGEGRRFRFGTYPETEMFVPLLRVDNRSVRLLRMREANGMSFHPPDDRAMIILRLQELSAFRQLADCPYHASWIRLYARHPTCVIAHVSAEARCGNQVPFTAEMEVRCSTTPVRPQERV